MFATAGDPPRVKITSKKKDDAVEVGADKEKTLFVVKSPGISQAFIDRLDETWPKTVVLRLHLKALENFRVSNGKDRLDAVVSIQEGKPKVRLWKDGKEGAPLEEKSPFWTDTPRQRRQAAKELPLKEGYFEVTLPMAVEHQCVTFGIERSTSPLPPFGERTRTGPLRTSDAMARKLAGETWKQGIFYLLVVLRVESQDEQIHTHVNRRWFRKP